MNKRSHTQEDTQMAEETLGRCTASYVTRALGVKMRIHHVTVIRRVRLEMMTTSNANKDLELKEPSCI